MSIFKSFKLFYPKMRSNRWYWLFYLFCRVSLAYAFIVAGMVKIVGERFANGLSELHPMGAYLTALHDTGYYYTFIGIAQVVAAILLLVPRTVLWGALVYLPIILNIWILSYAVRFEGSIVTSPLMTLANLFILVWHYDRLQYLLPIKKLKPLSFIEKPEQYSWRFPFAFVLLVIGISAGTIVFAIYGHEVMPRNSLRDCQQQFTGTMNEEAGYNFCNCIHQEGHSLNQCLEVYNSQEKSK